MEFTIPLEISAPPQARTLTDSDASAGGAAQAVWGAGGVRAGPPAAPSTDTIDPNQRPDNKFQTHDRMHI